MILGLTLGNELKLKAKRHQDDWKNTDKDFWYLIMTGKVSENITHIKCTECTSDLREFTSYTIYFHTTAMYTI